MAHTAPTTWQKLAAPFPYDAILWRIVRLADDQQTAQVHPQLRAAAVIARLNSVVGIAGWSNHFSPIGNEGLCCTLSVGEVRKSVVVSLGMGDAKDLPRSSAERADDALAKAAEHFAMLPPVDQTLSYWVDYDPENRVILYEPAPIAPVQPALAPVHSPADSVNSTEHGDAYPNDSYDDKSAGQQAIDRLLERLQQEGLGLEAAKLSISYGGYGSSPEAARAFYRELRGLLLKRNEASSIVDTSSADTPSASVSSTETSSDEVDHAR